MYGYVNAAITVLVSSYGNGRGGKRSRALEPPSAGASSPAARVCIAYTLRAPHHGGNGPQRRRSQLAVLQHDAQGAASQGPA
jgi:hypothetical protein